ncbi:thiol reductant ABC exporter subunit CydD [Gandjariella thermophila]|uniref:Thiol reductant ABC exporter subunit CydC n=1 Tax=Gandjariella thermophila TaxID=1931992 RepID=A0A4D4J9M8_9PSEU|nr:thiol reductant ABC exporter subunit CydD [Gandjariella thermophila]GDY31196.1 thiol reductant ABC exporter subunit CydC [Gandjariella thermophila]
MNGPPAAPRVGPPAIAPAGRGSRGPLGALPRLSGSARRALYGCGLLAALNAVALAVQAWAISSALADVVGHRSGLSTVADRAGVLAVAVVARAVLGWAIESVAARAAAGAKEELRARLLDRALTLGPEWIDARGPAELTVLATRGLDALDAYFTRYLPALVTAAVVPPLVGGYILLADPTSAMLIAITVPLIPVFAVLIGRHTEQRAARAADATARLSGHLLELVRALPVLTAFRRAEAQAEAVRRVGEQHRRTTLGTLRVAFLSAFVLELVATLSVALVAVDIGMRLVGGHLGLATGLLVLVLAPECYLPLRAAGAAHHASEDGMEAVRRVAEVLDEPVPAGAGGAAPGPGELRVDGLRVARRDGYAPDGLSLRVRPGEITRLDTPSGTGKSTTLGVLLGFVTPASGRITVGGTDLSTVDGAAWRARTAWIPQRPAFAGGTVAGELALAVTDQPGGPATRDELREVAGEAAAEHLLDRPVGELSTGERQRVAVARGLLRLRRGAWLLLADEPTAHLDPASAARVTAALHRAADRGAAVLLVSHRLADPDPSPSPAAPVLTAATPTTTPSRAALRRLVDRRLLGAAVLGAAALGCGVALTATSAWLIAKASQQPPILTLSVAVVAVRTFGLARGALRYAERLVSHDAAFRLAGALRVRLWRALVALGPARTAGLRRADGLQRLVDDTGTVRDLVPRVLLPPLVAGLVATGAVAVQAAVLPAAGLALAAALLVAGLGAPAVAVLAERRASHALAAGRRGVTTAVLGLLDAAADLIACGAHRPRRVELASRDAELAGRARRQAFGAGAATAVVTAATGLAALAGVVLAAAAVAAGRLDPVLAPLLGLLPLALAETLALLPPAAQQLGVLHATAGRLDEVLHAETGPPIRPDAAAEVCLDGVAARWPGAAAPTLRDVSLHLPAGSLVAVTGPSGAGKSTLLALLLGFLVPERGRADLPDAVAWCPQEPQLVSTTVRENLRLGDPHADDERLRRALRDAGLPGWTDRLDVRLGTGGAAISGGEAQRLALARALLAAEHADLVLLDEPTAHLDEPTARALLDRLRTVLAGRTVVHVTHRPEEAAGADLVIDLRAACEPHSEPAQRPRAARPVRAAGVVRAG